MAIQKKLSLGTVLVLHALARQVEYGFDIMEETGLTSGTDSAEWSGSDSSKSASRSLKRRADESVGTAREGERSVSFLSGMSMGGKSALLGSMRTLGTRIVRYACSSLVAADKHRELQLLGRRVSGFFEEVDAAGGSFTV